MNIKSKILEELYEQVRLNFISQIKKGQVERLEQLFVSLMSEIESQKLADKVILKLEQETKREENS